MVLPLLPLSHFEYGDPKEQRQFATDLVASLKRHGFVKIIDHGISDTEVEENFQRVYDTPSPIRLKLIRISVPIILCAPNRAKKSNHEPSWAGSSTRVE